MPQHVQELKGCHDAAPLTQGVSAQGANTEDIGHVIERLQSELQLLLLQRAAIVKRIGVIKHIIVGLADVFGADMVDKELQDLLSKRTNYAKTRSDPGLTEMCRRVLMEFSEALTVRQVCGRIQETNPSVLARQKQPTNSVTVVLRRLVSYREVKDSVNESDVRTWQWVGPRQRDGVVEESSPDAPATLDDSLTQDCTAREVIR
jgi:hypothetical protein